MRCYEKQTQSHRQKKHDQLEQTLLEEYSSIV
jgi:hypothetical protein